MPEALPKLKASAPDVVDETTGMLADTSTVVRNFPMLLRRSRAAAIDRRIDRTR
jgi:hypothetical protein